jgi:catechol 2,3-dioxygenase-like lactoylglutathione lyase family enzyme
MDAELRRSGVEWMNAALPHRRPETCLRAALHHFALESEAPAALAQFYEAALGFRFERSGAAWLGRAQDRQIMLVPGRSRQLAFAAYAVPDAAELRRLERRIGDAGWSWEPCETPFFAEALAISDPDGTRLIFGLPLDEADAAGATPPARLQHLVMASTNAQRVTTFFETVLGFTLSDTVVDGDGGVRTSFLRCSEEHHSFAVFQAAENRFDHHCYETRDWNAIRDWGDHMAAARIAVQWGPGRHGPGNNLFLFVHDSDGNWVELSAELEIVAHDRPVGMWPHEQRTLNSWGQGMLRS